MSEERRVALVTGASRGIGRACALALAEAGFTVAVNYHIDEERAKGVVEQIYNHHGQACEFQSDVSTPAGARDLVDAVLKHSERIDVLVCNAGVRDDDLMMRMSDEKWSHVIDTNLNSAAWLTKAVLRGMVKNRWGRLIYISSIAGIYGNVGQANYAAAKAGLIGLAKSTAAEVGKRNITANIVAPGFVETTFTDDLDERIKKRVVSLQAIPGFAQPEDIAPAVVFLASDGSARLTGSTITIDSGLNLLGGLE